MFAASRGENVTRNINAVEEKVAQNPTIELRNINLQENSTPSINKQFSQGNGPPLPRQLFPFYSIFQPLLTVVPIVDFSRPFVKTLSLLIEYNIGLISCTFHLEPSQLPPYCQTRCTHAQQPLARKLTNRRACADKRSCTFSPTLRDRRGGPELD